MQNQTFTTEDELRRFHQYLEDVAIFVGPTQNFIQQTLDKNESNLGRAINALLSLNALTLAAIPALASWKESAFESIDMAWSFASFCIGLVITVLVSLIRANAHQAVAAMYEERVLSMRSAFLKAYFSAHEETETFLKGIDKLYANDPAALEVKRLNRLTKWGIMGALFAFIYGVANLLTPVFG